MAKIAKVQEVAIADLKPYERNAKIHDSRQIEKLMASIEEFGFVSPCLIDSDLNLIAGHGRVMAAAELGMETVPCVFIGGLTDEQRRAYILADNRLAEMATWEMDLVAEELSKLREDGFDIDITGFALDDQIIDNDEIEELTINEDFTPLSGERRTEQGQLWELGDHRLMVGDSTAIDDVTFLTGGGRIDLLETDPPYNVNYKSSSGDSIINDDIKDADFREFLYDAFSNACAVMKDGAAFYIWHADSNGLQFREACMKAGLTVKQNLVWVKNRFTLGRQDYQWRHEPCLYGWKEGAPHYFSEKRNISTIIQSRDVIESSTREELIEYVLSLFDRSTVMEESTDINDLHPTMKPLTLIMRQVKNSSREGESVLDLFGGSGTTLIACERLNRKCYMMEYDTKYADVIIDRWEKETDKKAILIAEKPR